MGSKGPTAPNAVGTAAGLQSNAVNTGFGALSPAISYFQKLLTGGVGAQNAVAPAAMNISQAYTGARNSIQNFQPQGGEKNLALAQLQPQQAGAVSNLYANVQPQAAAALGGLGTNLLGVGNSAGQNLVNYQQGQNQQKGQSLGGVGQGAAKFLGNQTNPGGFLAK